MDKKLLTANYIEERHEDDGCTLTILELKLSHRSTTFNIEIISHIFVFDLRLPKKKNRFSSHFQMHNYTEIFQQFQTSHCNKYFIYITQC